MTGRLARTRYVGHWLIETDSRITVAACNLLQITPLAARWCQSDRRLPAALEVHRHRGPAEQTDSVVTLRTRCTRRGRLSLIGLLDALEAGCDEQHRDEA